MLLPIVVIALALLISLVAVGCKKKSSGGGGGGYLGRHHQVSVAAQSF